MAHRSIGLDIGTSAVRAAELSLDDGGRPTLEAFGQVGLQPGSVLSGEVRDRAHVSAALQRLWKDGGFSHRRVQVGFASLRAIIREIDMPMLPPEELETAVRFQADQVIPFAISETALSSKVVAQVANSDGPPKLRVLVAAAHNELVEAIIGAVEDAGLDPVTIDLQSAALARALADPNYEPPEAIVSIGSSLTMVVIHQGGRLQFVRTLDTGGETITAAIAHTLDLPLRDAEALKRGLGYPGTHDAAAIASLDRSVNALVGEIRNSIRFYSSMPGHQPVGRMQVTGGGARTAGLFRLLQQTSGLPVAVASPLSRVNVDLPLSPEQAAEIDGMVASAVGLAIPDPQGKPFNLLPPAAKMRSTERRVHRHMVRVAAGLVALMVVLSGWRLFSVHSAQNNLNTVVAQNATISRVEIPKYDKALMLRNQVVALSAQVLPALTNEVDWLVVLNQIGQYIPPAATLASITMNAANAPTTSATSSSSPAAPTTGASIGTISTSVIAKTLTDVTAWGQSMSQSPIFNNVNLSGGVSSNSSVAFSATLNILKGAQSQRLAEYSVPSK
jgi:type IV pilus assembly protein PilM